MSETENTLYSDSRLVGIYDSLNAGDHDFTFYEAQIGTQPKYVLDVGCGTGVFAVRLASAGHKVVAVDPSPAMLGYARKRAGADTVNWLAGDAAAAPGDTLFDVETMTGHAFQCLLTDDEVAATLRAVRERLSPGGQFMFETRNPAVQPWLGWTAQHSRRAIRTDDCSQVEVFHECTSVRREIVEFDTHYVFVDAGVHLTSRSQLRFMSQPVLARHLDAAGFGEVTWIGGWDGRPFDEASSAEIIAICWNDQASVRRLQDFEHAIHRTV